VNVKAVVLTSEGRRNDERLAFGRESRHGRENPRQECDTRLHDHKPRDRLRGPDGSVAWACRAETWETNSGQAPRWVKGSVTLARRASAFRQRGSGQVQGETQPVELHRRTGTAGDRKPQWLGLAWVNRGLTAATLYRFAMLNMSVIKSILKRSLKLMRLENAQIVEHGPRLGSSVAAQIAVQRLHGSRCSPPGKAPGRLRWESTSSSPQDSRARYTRD